MKVLVIAPTPYFSDRGCHIRIAEELRALYTAGHSATVFTYHLGRNFGPASIQRIRRIPWYGKTSAGPSWHKLYLDGLLLFKILTTVCRGEFNVIHAHLHEGTAIGWIVARWFRLPLVADWQSELIAELRSYRWMVPGFTRGVRWYQGWLIKQVDWLYVSSPQALRALQRHYPKHCHKMELLLDGVAAVPPARSVNPDHSTVPTIVYAGGMSAAKGVPVLLNTLTQLANQHVVFKMLLIGDCTAQQRTRLDQSQLATHIEYHTHVPYDQLMSILQRADIGVDPKPPTSTESSGKILNYMAAGLATIAFYSPTTEQLIEQAGLLVSEPSATALADHLKILIHDTALRTQLGQAARTRIQKRFLWSMVFIPVLRRYEKLVK